MISTLKTTAVGGKAQNHSCCGVSVKLCQFGTIWSLHPPLQQAAHCLCRAADTTLLSLSCPVILLTIIVNVGMS